MPVLFCSDGQPGIRWAAARDRLRQDHGRSCDAVAPCLIHHRRRSWLRGAWLATTVCGLFAPWMLWKEPLEMQLGTNTVGGISGSKTGKKRRALDPPPSDIPDDRVCDLAARDFRAASGLYCIVTGLEHSGTTVMVQLIMSAPNIFGGLECGMLSNPEPSLFVDALPFYTWMGIDTHFGITAEQRDKLLPTSECHAQMYQRLRRHSSFFLRSPYESQRRSWIVDKTPRYVRFLDQVMDRSPGVPVVVTQKSKQDQIRSIVKHMEHTSSEAREKLPMRKKKNLARMAIARAEAGLQRALTKYGPSGRITVVNVTELYEDPNRIMSRVFDFLRLDWKPEYLTMDAVNSKRLLVGVERNLTSFDPSALKSKNVTKKVQE